MYRYLFASLFLLLLTSSISAQQYVVNQTIPASGTANVSINTTLSVTFDAELDTDAILEALEDDEEIFLVIPFESITPTEFRFSNNNRTIEMDAILQPDTDYYMIFIAVPFAEYLRLLTSS